MKKGLFVFVALVMMTGMASALCDISVSLLNQDPYPAVPGEYVKVVFQISGTETTDCRNFYFDIVPKYPFSVESNNTRVVLLGGNYISGYSTSVLKAYKLIVDAEALSGDQKVEVSYGYTESGGSTAKYSKEFEINVQDTRTDFDVSIQDYDAAKKTVTFGIVNIGKIDVESLTLEILEQDNVDLKGASKTIIGSLNSNDDTTASIEAVPKEGDITVRLTYNDEANVRRSVDKLVRFDNRYLLNGTTAQPRGGYFYLFWLLVIVLVVYAYYRYRKNKKAKNNKLAGMRR